MTSRFYIDPSKAGKSDIMITGSDANHMKNVLRLNINDNIIVFDGKGKEFNAKIKSFSPQGINVAVMENITCEKESPASITIAQGFLKDKKMDILIRQLTELGITCWIPFFAQRSIARPDKKRLQTRIQRWEKIAQESLKQCRRTCIPEVKPILSFEKMLSESKIFDIKLIFWEENIREQNFAFSSELKQSKKIFAILGPEGGLSKQEIQVAKNFGFKTASLGPRILRAETATIAACTLLQYFFGDIK